MPMPERGFSPLVPVGHLSKAHGIRGELLLVFTADSPEILNGELTLRPRGQGEERRLLLEGLRAHHGNLLVSFAGVTTRDEAELLRHHAVFVPKDRLPALRDDELYLSDLPGLRVFAVAPDDARAGASARNGTQASQGGREIGVIASVDLPAGQEIWTIRSPCGKEILFPAADQFVISIQPDEGLAVIAPPPGLIELYLSDSTT
jgi:16S rRNA processing protein RimM